MSNGPSEKNAIKATMNAFIAGLPGKPRSQAVNEVGTLLDALRPRINAVIKKTNAAQKSSIMNEFDEKEEEVHTAIKALPESATPPGGGPRRNRKQTGGRKKTRKAKRSTKKRHSRKH